GGAAAGDVGEILLDHRGVLRRQAAAHRLADHLALPRRQVQERTIALLGVGELRLGVADLAVGDAVAAALALVLLLGRALALTLPLPWSLGLALSLSLALTLSGFLALPLALSGFLTLALSLPLT